MLIALGLALLLAPAGGCGVVVRAWTASPTELPADTPPQLDDAEVARDAAAVRAAQAALAAWHPTPAAPAATPAATTSTKRVTVPQVDAREVAAAKAAVDLAHRDVAAAQAELDRLLAEQEASSDPGSYDGQVAAAREELERSVAALDEAQRELRTARSRTASVVVTTSPRPAPAPRASPSAERAALLARLADAQQVQAAHLAARKKAVAAWRTTYQEQVARVGAHNADVRSCAARAAVPGTAGAGLLVLGSGALAWRRLRLPARAVRTSRRSRGLGR